jgi:hypothetical protein
VGSIHEINEHKESLGTGYLVQAYFDIYALLQRELFEVLNHPLSSRTIVTDY